MDQDVSDFINKLMNGSPELVAVHLEHIADQGELLPHVLMADITRLVVATASRGECPDWVVRLLAQLESGLIAGSSEVAELVGVSFVENLCGEAEAVATLRPSMGMALRRELRAICNP